MTQQRNIGRYQILEDIAAGAQGSVYQAYDTETSQIVALKVLHPHLSQDTEYLERFRREATVTISINHPNVVKIFEVGRDGNQYFMSMEYLPQNLARILSTDRKLDINQTIQFGMQMCEGLVAAHSLNVVHRDLKPQNILIGTAGEAKVTDFGIARASQMSTMTATGAIMGTPLYMSPEAAQGESVDKRSDIYSLGCVLYEMIAGKVPFDGNTPLVIMQQHAQNSPESLRNLRKDTPNDLVNIVQRAMEKDPGKRFQNASELLDALKSLGVAPPSAISFDVQALPSDKITDTFMDRYARAWQKSNKKKWAWLGTTFSILTALSLVAFRMGLFQEDWQETLQQRLGIQLPGQTTSITQQELTSPTPLPQFAMMPPVITPTVAPTLTPVPPTPSPVTLSGTADTTPVPTPTVVFTPTPVIPTPTPTVTPTTTYTPVPTPTTTPTPFPTPTLTPFPTPTPTHTPSPTPTYIPTSTPTRIATAYVATSTPSVIMPTNLLIMVDGNDWNMPTRSIMINEKVGVSYTNMTTSNGEWIGLFKPGDGYAQFTSYKVLSSESGSFTVKMQPIAGQYELRMYDNTNKLLLKSPVMTVSPPPTQTPLPTATPTITPTPINPDDLGGGPIFDGQKRSAEIDFHKDTDEWTFSGNKGQIVTIIMNSNGEVDPFIRLIAPSGSEEIWIDDYGGTTDAWIDSWTLQETGTYTIIAQSSKATFEDPSKVGTYALSLEFALQGTPTPTPTPNIVPTPTPSTSTATSTTAVITPTPTAVSSAPYTVSRIIITGKDNPQGYGDAQIYSPAGELKYTIPLPTTDGKARWSPDGTKIAYTSGERAVMIMNADGSNKQEVVSKSTFELPQEVKDDYPWLSQQNVILNTNGSTVDWSPDGSKLVFSAMERLWTINLDGSGLTHIHTAGYDPRWASDNSAIYFVSEGIGSIPPGGGSATYIRANIQVFIINGVPNNLIDALIHNVEISSDSRKLISYVWGSSVNYPAPEEDSQRSCTNNANNDGENMRNCALIMDMDGTIQAVLGNNNSTTNYINAVWSPDGTKVAVVSDGIVVMNADGSNPIQIVNGRTDMDIFIDWTD